MAHVDEIGTIRIEEQRWFRALLERASRVEFVGVLPGHLRPGVLRRPAIMRPTLVDRVATSGADIVVVTGLAGSGKTSLLCEWAQRWPNDRLGWLSLHPCHNNLVRFWNGLVAALRVAVGESVDLTGLHGASDGARPDIEMLRSALDAAGPEPLALVLDDFHQVISPEVLELCARLADEKLPNETLVISTRTPPDLRIARSHAAGQVVELTHDDLTLSLDEATAMLTATLGPIDRPLVRRLLHETGGWPAMMSLAGQLASSAEGLTSLLERGLAANRWLVDFVVDELLDLQPDDLRAFLLETAFLSELSAGLCDAVRGRHDSARHLASLERQELLAGLDDTGTWWRHHHLVRRLIAKRAALELGDLRPMRARAAVWFGEAGRHGEAVHHGLAAQQFDIVIEHVIPAMTRFQVPSGSETEWFDELPDDIIVADADFLGAIALYVRVLGSRDQRERLDRLLVQVRDDVPAIDGDAPVHTLSIDWAAALDREVPRLRAVVDACRSEDLPALWRPFWPALGVYAHFALDDLQTALTVSEQGLAAWPTGLVRRTLVGFHSVLLHHLGRPTEADHWIALYDGSSHSILADQSIEWARGLRAQRQGDRAGVDQHFETAIALIHDTAWTRLLIAIDHATALGRLGDLDEARHVLLDVRLGLDTLVDPGPLVGRCDQVAVELGVSELEVEPVRAAGRRRGLSDRELDVAQLLVTEMTLGDIARELFISRNTVKSHVRAIYRKFDVASRTDLCDLIGGA